MRVVVAAAALATTLLGPAQHSARTRPLHVSVAVRPNPVARGSVLRVYVRTHPHAFCIGGLAYADTAQVATKDTNANGHGRIVWRFRVRTRYRHGTAMAYCQWFHRRRLREGGAYRNFRVVTPHH